MAVRMTSRDCHNQMYIIVGASWYYLDDVHLDGAPVMKNRSEFVSNLCLAKINRSEGVGRSALSSYLRAIRKEQELTKKSLLQSSSPVKGQVSNSVRDIQGMLAALNPVNFHHRDISILDLANINQ